MHKAEQIRDAVYYKVESLITEGVITVAAKNTAEPVSQSGTVNVRLGEDTPLQELGTFTDWDLEVFTDVYVRSVIDDLDSLILPIRTAIHKALMLDETLGLSFVIHIKPLGQSEPERVKDGDEYTSASRLSWQVRYRANRKDPSL